jgi:hypothetical protein
MDFDKDKYGKTISHLIDPKKLNSLGQGKEDKELKSLLKNIDLDVAFSPHQVVNSEYAQACLSALWLHHDFLSESHSISQIIGNQSGSFWHGIMHRREGDYWNSKYWFQRVGSHPIFTNLTIELNKIAEKENLEPKLSTITDTSEWDPFTFIDLCERSFKSGSAQEKVCERIQRLEWQLLFDFCYKKTIAI